MLNNANNHGLIDQVRGDTKLIYGSLNVEEDTISDFSFDSDGFTVQGTDNTYNGSYNYVAWNWDAGTANTVASTLNADQTWSSSLTSSHGGVTAATNAFNNDVSTYAKTGSYGSDRTLTFGPSTAVNFSSKLEVYCDQGSATPTATWNSNTVNPGSGAWVTVYNGSGSISSSTPLVIDSESTSEFATLGGVRLDGKVLTDPALAHSVSAGGLNDDIYDTSEDWSANFANGNNDTSDTGQAFRGITNATGTSLSSEENSGSGYWLSLTDVAFSVTSTISLWVHDPGSISIEMEYNGTTYTNSSPTRFGWTDFTVPSGSNSGTLKARLTSSGDEIRGVKVDGKILVDSNLTVPNVPTIKTTYRANPTAGFSILTYTGNATSGATVAHGLNAKPAFGMFKARETDGYTWYVYHKELGNTHNLYLNLNSAKNDDSGAWNDTDPDSNVMTLGNATPNPSGEDMVAYIWSEVAGYSKFGSFTGNGIEDGPFVYCGFKPAFIMFGPNVNYCDWYIYDNERWALNPAEDPLAANETMSEANFDDRPVTNHVDILSNGFKLKFADSSGYHNYSGWVYSFVAFADRPFKYANAR